MVVVNIIPNRRGLVGFLHGDFFYIPTGKNFTPRIIINFSLPRFCSPFFWFIKIVVNSFFF